jgi:hypothetical protein
LYEEEERIRGKSRRNQNEKIEITRSLASSLSTSFGFVGISADASSLKIPDNSIEPTSISSPISLFELF